MIMRERIFQSPKHALSKTAIYLGFFSAVVTILGIIGFENIAETVFMRVVIVIGIFIFAFLVACIRCLFFYRRVKVPLGGGRIAYIEYGDLFSKKGVIVVPCNRYFDTQINEKIVNAKPVMGNFVKNAYPGNISQLDNDISKSINGIPTESTNKEGKNSKYPIGTIANVSKGGNDYYCLALTDVNLDSNNSFCDLDMLYKSLVKLLNFINENAGKKDVFMPVLGAGFSRLGKEKQIILDFIIAVFKASDVKLQSKLHIVLLEEECEFYNLTKKY